jgi:protein TonB
MPRELFGEVTRPSISIGSRKWYTLPLSLFSHSAIVALLIALPILAPAVMPSVFADDDPTWITASLPSPPPPPVRQRPVVTPPPDGQVAPTHVPAGVAPERPLIDAGWEDAHGAPIRVFGDFDKDLIAGPPPPPPAPPPQKPLRVGSSIRRPMKVRNVDPVYSPLAQMAKIQGLVIIEATIGPDGRVVDARILRSLPMLDQSALDAVRQWEFTPTLLNGVAVPVVMTVTVNFTLK